MDCNAAKSRIFPYVDGELGPDAQAEMGAHLATCGSCARLVNLELRFHAIYTQRLGPEPAPPHVREQVTRRMADLARRSAAGTTAPPPRRRPWRARMALGLVAVALVALGAAAALILDSMLSSRGALVDLAEAAVEQHQKLTRDVLPADIRGVSPRGAEEWFRKRLAFNISLPDLPNDRLTFRGGRISHLRGVEAAALEYEVEGSDVSLFIVPAEAYRQLHLSQPPRFKLITRRGYDVIVWQSHEKGIGYALVSEIGGRACLVCHSAEEVRESAAKLSVHR